MPLIDHRDIARQHRTKLLQSVARTVGTGKTVAVRAATAALDPSRHVIIYLPDPTIGVRGMLTHIVAALGHTPAYHKATLAPQPPRPWPANTPNAAATQCSSSTRPTHLMTNSSKPSGS